MSRYWVAIWILVVWVFQAMGVSAQSPESSSSLMGFDQALDAIVERSLSVAAQEAQREAVYYRNMSSRLALLPEVTLQGKQTFTQPHDGKRFNARGVSATVALNVFRFGADRAAMQAASLEDRQQAYWIEQRLLETEKEGAKAVFRVVETSMMVAVLQQTVKMRSTILGIAKQRYAKGLLPREQLEKIHIDKENDQAQLEDARVERDRAEGNLAELLGHSNVMLTWPWKEWFQTQPHFPDPASDIVVTRPDYQATRLTVESAQARVKQAWGTMLPSVDVQFQGNVFKGGSPSAFGPDWTGMVTVSVPLFDRLSGYGEYRAKVSETVKAETELERIRRRALREWWVAKKTLKRVLSSTRSLEAILGKIRYLFDQNVARFRHGRIKANELVLDEARLLDAQRLAIQGWRHVHNAFVDWCHAPGRRIKACIQQ